MKSRRYDAILFDMGYTLVYFEPPTGIIVQEALCAAGAERSVAEIEAALEAGPDRVIEHPDGWLVAVARLDSSQGAAAAAAAPATGQERRQAAQVLQLSRVTLYRWERRMKNRGLRGLEDRSRRQTRRRRAVRRRRCRVPCWR